VSCPRLQEQVLSKLKVSHLTRNVTDEHLIEIFSTFGKVKSAHVAVHPAVRLSKGYGYVEYHSQADADKARIYMNGAQIDGNDVEVNFVLMPRKRVVPATSQVRATAPRRTDADAPRRHTEDDRGMAASPRRPPPRARTPPRRRLTPSPRPGASRRDFRERSPPRGGAYRRRSLTPPRRRLTPPMRSGRDIRVRPPPVAYRSRTPPRRLDRHYSPPPRRFERRSPPRGGGYRPRSRSPIGRGVPPRRSPRRSPPRRGGRSRSASPRQPARSPRRSRSPRRPRSYSSRSRSSSYSSHSRSGSSSSRSRSSFSGRSHSAASKDKSKTPLPGPPPPQESQALPPPPPRP
jgi:RNA-binding protein with serine-rich domain 1